MFKFSDYYPDDKVLELVTQIEEACRRVKRSRKEDKND